MYANKMQEHDSSYERKLPPFLNFCYHLQVQPKNGKVEGYL